ncbi:disintegrin and metalloproteinase domain-containing protein 9-like [Ambystoma mexicanum]|uniref:disintegrin and metalloproteinase domain-containing protein 9-like n=1 Tax=Ambystoma mexicanum TaxID=8296 RepID=UPI0037E8BF04
MMAAVRMGATLYSLMFVLVSSQDFNQTSFSAYEVIIPKELKQNGDSTGMFVHYAIMAEGKQYVLHLKRKTIVISSAFSVYTYRDRRTPVFQVSYIKDDCYYHGYVEGFPDSIVGLSTCSGLSGFLHDRNFSYAIEPVKPFLHYKHHIYPVEYTESLTCGVNNFSVGINNNINQQQMEKRRTNAAYMELFVIVTHPLFEFYKRNETLVLNHITATINIVDAIYQKVNVHIMLIGIEIWAKGNQINTNIEDPRVLLSSFSEWKVKNLDSRIKCDAALLVMKEARVLVSGMTNLGGVCHPFVSTLFMVFPSTTILNSALQVSHEIGHLLGMHHDNRNKCKCERRNLCLMEPTGKITLGISGCSMHDLESFLNSEASFCLWNIPSAEPVISKTQICGNKHVEIGEECDCGFPQECTNVCCDPETCRLIKGASCASGECCKRCQLAALGTPCRIPVTECDLAEYCDGLLSTCPADVYFQDGTPCNRNRSVCYNNNCYDFTKHCKRIFGKETEVASLECFSAVNTIGDRFGNCDLKKGTEKCIQKDVMCGRLQCQNVTEIHLPDHHTSIIQTPFGSSWCWGIESFFDGGLVDLGFVPSGARCDVGKVCINKACVDESVLNYDCNVKTKCHGHGVCNSNKNCHCDKDWAPPNCAEDGFGGSIDSGPLDKDSFISYRSSDYMSSATGSFNMSWHAMRKLVTFSIAVSIIIPVAIVKTTR